MNSTFSPSIFTSPVEVIAPEFKVPATKVFPLVAFTVNLFVLIAKSPVKATFPVVALAVNLLVLTAKSPVLDNPRVVVADPVIVKAVPA